MADQWDQYVEQPSASAADKWDQYVEKPATAPGAEEKSPDRPGAMASIKEDIGPALKGIGTSLLLGPLAGPVNAIRKGIDEYQAVRSTGKTSEQQHNEDQEKAGYGPFYRRLLTPIGENVGVNVRGMEHSAELGDEAGVMGHTVVPAAMAAAPLVAEAAGRAVPPTVRTAARVTNKVLEKAPEAVGGAVGATAGHYLAGPVGAELGGAGGVAFGRQMFGKLRVPGEEFGLPKPVYPGGPKPATPAPELLNANRAFARGPQVYRDPAAGLGWVRGQVPIDGEYVAPEPDEPSGPAYAPAEVVTPPRQLEGLPNRPQLPARGSPIALADEYPGVNSPPGPRQPTEPIIRTTRSSPLRILGTRLLDWAGVADETESQALQDAIDHGEPIGRPLRGQPAGVPGDEPLPVDPKFTEDGEKLAVQFPPARAATAELAAETPASRAALGRTLDDKLGGALGAARIRPGVKIRDQFKPEADTDIEEGHTPVESSALKSFKYDADKHELHVTTKTGTTYVSGEVTPEQAANFKNAESKGKAWNELRKASPLVAKIVNGKRVAAKPTEFRSVGPNDDLTDLLEQSVEHAKQHGKPGR